MCWQKAFAHSAWCTVERLKGKSMRNVDLDADGLVTYRDSKYRKPDRSPVAWELPARRSSQCSKASLAARCRPSAAWQIPGRRASTNRAYGWWKHKADWMAWDLDERRRDRGDKKPQTRQSWEQLPTLVRWIESRECDPEARLLLGTPWLSTRRRIRDLRRRGTKSRYSGDFHSEEGCRPKTE